MSEVKPQLGGGMNCVLAAEKKERNCWITLELNLRVILSYIKNVKELSGFGWYIILL